MIDSHCHLYSISNLEEKLQSAQSSGINYFLSVGTDSLHMFQNIEIANKHDNIVCSIGIHPSECFCQYDIQEMKKLALSEKKIVAIGEVGLEYHYLDVPKSDQLRLFSNMLQLAVDTGLPVILHCRECFSAELFELINSYKIQAVFHCFSDSLKNARKIIENGYYLSFSGIVTFKKCNELRQVAKYVPDDKILIETDSPYLAPVPMRGNPNEPAFVQYVARCIAQQRNCSLEHIERITNDNFFNLFPKAKILLCN